MPTFYKETIMHWLNLRRQPADTIGILDEVIWYNKISVDNLRTFYPSFYEKSIILLNENGQFYEYTRGETKYNINRNCLTL